MKQVNDLSWIYKSHSSILFNRNVAIATIFSLTFRKAKFQYPYEYLTPKAVLVDNFLNPDVS